MQITLNKIFVDRTHWKTTSCRPNNMDEEMALAAAAGSPPGYYEYTTSDITIGKYFFLGYNYYNLVFLVSKAESNRNSSGAIHLQFSLSTLCLDRFMYFYFKI